MRPSGSGGSAAGQVPVHRGCESAKEHRGSEKGTPGAPEPVNFVLRPGTERRGQPYRCDAGRLTSLLVKEAGDDHDGSCYRRAAPRPQGTEPEGHRLSLPRVRSPGSRCQPCSTGDDAKLAPAKRG